jgi:hypothetical protein
MTQPIQPEFHETMNALAHGLDDIFNGTKLPGLPRKSEVCFVLLTTRFGDIHGGRVNYISNGERQDVIATLRELLARFEGRYVDGATEARQ